VCVVIVVQRRCRFAYGDNTALTLWHHHIFLVGRCHAWSVHIKLILESRLFLVTVSCTELRPLLLLSAWPIFCILDTSITCQIRHQIRPQRSSTIHDLGHELSNLLLFVVWGDWRETVLLNWRWLVVSGPPVQQRAENVSWEVTVTWQVNFTFHSSFLFHTLSSCFLILNKVLYIV